MKNKLLMQYATVTKVLNSVIIMQKQGQIQPVSLGPGDFTSIIFCSQVLSRVHYCMRHEVYFTTLL